MRNTEVTLANRHFHTNTAPMEQRNSANNK